MPDAAHGAWFRCPGCGDPALAIAATLELAADSRSDEIQAQLLRCGSCDVVAAGVYEESRRGAGDVVDHRGWVIDRPTWEQIFHWWSQCPEPGDGACECQVHRAWLAEYGGRNITIQGLRTTDGFELRLP